MAYTIQQLETLKSAIAQGTLKVKYGDKEVEYRSLNEMLQIKALMEKELYPATNSNKGRKFSSFSKGVY